LHAAFVTERACGAFPKSETMTLLLTTVALLLAAQAVCARLARRERARLMRPADLWEPEDVDRWLALIEPFDLFHVPADSPADPSKR
jgi:hypothetical protein